MLRLDRSLLLFAFVLLVITPTDAASAAHGIFGAGMGTPVSVAPVDGGYGTSVGPPGPQRYPVYASGNYPWYGYGFGVPTYNWGYFGVHYRPSNYVHTGYYEDYYQWGYRRGY